MTTRTATIEGIEHIPLPAIREFLRLFFKRGHVTAELAHEAFTTHWHWPHYEAHYAAAAFVRQIQALDNADTRAIEEDLPALDRPARIVWGVADQFQKIEYGERLARDLAAPLRRIEDGKHFTPEDFPEIVAEEIMALVGATWSAA